MDSIIFNNLNKIVSQPELLCEKTTQNQWQVMPYATGDIAGNLLVAGELTSPEDVTLKLGLSGWHKIYIAMMDMRSANYLHMKLTDDAYFEGIQMPFQPSTGEGARGSEYQWAAEEFAEEFYWKSADLTGQDIILSKPVSHVPLTSCLLWIKCVPMTEEEIAAHRSYHDTRLTACVHGHIDEDPNGQDQSDRIEKLLVKEGPLAGTDINEVSLEVSFDYTYDPSLGEHLPLCLTRTHQAWQEGDQLFSGIKETATRERVRFLHENNIQVYAANRMSVCQFQTPYSNAYFSAYNFAGEHPEYYCKMRNSATVKVCSYAYEEVQDYVVDQLVRFMDYGFDGVSLIFHRGLHIAFEEPVLRRFAERYPGVDPFVLPAADERLNGVWSGFMTEFMRKLRKALDAVSDKHLKINVITDFSPSTSKLFGLDVEQWANAHLIDTVLQGIMETFEDLDGCLNADGTIDMVRYNEKLKTDYIIKRSYPFKITEKVIDGFREYKTFCEPNGVAFYGAFPWEHAVTPEAFVTIAAQMREAGIEKFIMWNLNHAMKDLRELHAISMAGHKEIDPDTYGLNRYRIMSLDGSNISAFNPNWRG